MCCQGPLALLVTPGGTVLGLVPAVADALHNEVRVLYTHNKSLEITLSITFYKLHFSPPALMSSHHQVGYDCEMVLLFDCPDEVMLERLRGRGQASGRADDNEDTIRKRVQVGGWGGNRAPGTWVGQERTAGVQRAVGRARCRACRYRLQVHVAALGANWGR